LKGLKEFQKEDECVFIVSNINSLDEVFLSIDLNRNVCETIEFIRKKLFADFDLAVANCGDQNNNSMPEVPICLYLEIESIHGLGDKFHS
jgi:hypothetical protein